MRPITFIINAAAVGHRLRGRIRGRAFDGSEDGRKTGIVRMVGPVL